MPSSIPVVPGAKVVKALKSAGFTVTRIKGSHHFMRYPDGRAASVPVHSGDDVPKGTTRDILSSVGMTPDEFRGSLSLQFRPHLSIADQQTHDPLAASPG